MSFVNEYISPEDFDRYRIDLLNQRPRNTVGTAPSGVWTIDRSTDTWLRRFCEETDPTAPNARLTGVSLWDFHWGGEVMEIKLLLEDANRVPKNGMRRKKLLELEMSSTLARFQWQVLLDLDVALNTYLNGGAASDDAILSILPVQRL